MQKILIFFIRAYSYVVSPFLPPSCRFTPTCSAYAKQAITKYGAFRGSFLAGKRLCKCHPFHEGGHDPLT